jgi:hypothetical protein
VTGRQKKVNPFGLLMVSVPEKEIMEIPVLDILVDIYLGADCYLLLLAVSATS